MKTLSLTLLLCLILNVAAIDVVAFKVDRSFRIQRDMVCDVPLPTLASTPCSPPALGMCLDVVWSPRNYSLLTMDELTGKSTIALHFYGCDINGHKYRMWLEDGDVKEKIK
jgi:hypothetical protein